MWPRKHCVLRLGRHECQLWLKQGRHLQWLAKRALLPVEANAPYAPLANAIQHLAAFVPGKARVLVIADSHWLPALLLDTGHTPLTGHQVQALAAHRFAEARGEAARHWLFMTDYVAGDCKTLAFGCPPGLHQAISESFAAHLSPGALAGLQPTLSWAMASAKNRPSGKASLCTILREQDRNLLVFTRGSDLQGLHPSAMLGSKEPQQLVRDVPLHAWRCGASAQEWAVHVLSFDAVPTRAAHDSTGAQVTWATLASSEPTP